MSSQEFVEGNAILVVVAVVLPQLLLPQLLLSQLHQQEADALIVHLIGMIVVVLSTIVHGIPSQTVAKGMGMVTPTWERLPTRHVVIVEEAQEMHQRPLLQGLLHPQEAPVPGRISMKI